MRNAKTHVRRDTGFLVELTPLAINIKLTINKKMKAIYLARVSSTEQEEAGNSNPAQEARILAYIKRSPNLECKKGFVFTESAYKERRAEFDEVLEYIYSFKDEVVALCCDKVDRLTRDFLIGLPALERMRREGRIELHFPSDNLVLHQYSPATNLFHFNIAVSLAQYYLNAISDNVKRAYEQKLRKGEWIGAAKLGYLNIKATKDVVVDPQRSPFIKKVFELYVMGNISMRSIAQKMKEEGLTARSGKYLSPSQIEKILKDPFYYGMMRVNGKLYPHKYPPLISFALFKRAEEVRLGWEKKPFKYGSRAFTFKGLMTCKKCGAMITPEIKKGKYVYYSCTNYFGKCSRLYINENDLLKPIYEILAKMMNVSQDRFDEIVTDLKSINESKSLYHEQALQALRGVLLANMQEVAQVF